MEKLKDVVCGMMIDPKEAAAPLEYKGKTYYIGGSLRVNFLGMRLLSLTGRFIRGIMRARL
jgi:hypothetical protein